MASQPDVFQSCLLEAAKSAKPALEKCINSAIASLQLAETKSAKMAERDTLATAWRMLQERKPAWSLRYQIDLLAAFHQKVTATTLVENAEKTNNSQIPLNSLVSSSPVSRSRSMSLESLSLVGDADVTQAIESQRLLQQILPRVEQTLAELDTLISSAQGLANVRPELNPLRPEVFAKTLQDLLVAAAAPVDPQLTGLWIKHLAEPLGQELKTLYQKITGLLESAQVPAATYRVLQTPASAMGRRGGGGSGSNKGPAASSEKQAGNADGHGDDFKGTGSADGATLEPSQYADLSNYEIRDELFQNFLFNGGSNANQGLAPSYYATIEKELKHLHAASDYEAGTLPEASGDAVQATDDTAYGKHSNYHQTAAVDRPQRRVDVSSPLNAKVWGAYAKARDRALVRTQLRKEATKVGQVLGLEVVRKLVNQVAQDPRLLVPVRQSIVALEPSLLRLAMVDPRFFSDEKHAGRRLMERVAQRSFKYNDEFSPEFAEFFAAVTARFNLLNTQDIDDAKPFAAALALLEQGWSESDQQEQEAKRKVLTALRFAEERQERADQIAFDLSARSDLEKVPGVVLDFLFGTWSLVLAHAKLADDRNQIDPGGFGSVVPDLLWSVKRDVTLKQPAKLIEMIPPLLEKLHAGLRLIDQDVRENEVFFEALMKMHQPVLKLRQLKTKRDAEESSAMPLAAHDEDAAIATPEQRIAKPAEQLWLGRDDLDMAGFEDTQPTEAGELDMVADDNMSEWQFANAADANAPSNADTQADMQPEKAFDAPPSAPKSVNSKPAPLIEKYQKPPNYAPSEAEAILQNLRANDWVDLYSRRHWLRAQLIWASNKGTLFMFLSHGGQPHSMTKRSCEKLIAQRLLRPIDAHGVVAQALNAVALEAAAQSAAAKQAAPHANLEAVQ